MSDKEENTPARQPSDYDKLVYVIREICSSRTATEKLIRLLSDAIEIDGADMASVVGSNTNPRDRVMFLVGHQSAYRDLRNAACRALALEGEKPSPSNTPESAALAPI